jgi:DNA-binding NarL/FixJ family response regulator
VRELQTLALVAEGKPYGVIAEHLHVSYKTVANTCTQLKAKLGEAIIALDRTLSERDALLAEIGMPAGKLAA